MTIDELRRRKDVGIVIADHRGLITYVNENFQSLFGWSSEDLVGRLLTTIIPKSMHEAHHLGFSRFVTTGQATLLGQSLGLKVATKDGRELNAEHTIFAEDQGGEWVFGATIRLLQ